MTNRSTGRPNLLPLNEAAEMLHLEPKTVVDLARAGYLPAVDTGAAGSLFPMGDTKAFLARNADYGSGNLLLEAPDSDDLLAVLDGECKKMARRAYEIFSAAFPETANWGLSEQARFINQAAGRFEAILAVASHGVEVDEAFTDDLREVGAAAAWARSPLPQLLVILRISRDLVVQTAVELAEERGGKWSLSLSLLLTRVLPVMDQLTDSIAQGYWAAVVEREAEQRALYEHAVEHSPEGVYEVDLDGRLRYANPSLADILGRHLEELQDAVLAEVVAAEEGAAALQPLLEDTSGGRPVELVVVRPDGARRVLEVRATVRSRDGVAVAFQGLVRDVTVAGDQEALHDSAGGR